MYLRLSLPAAPQLRLVRAREKRKGQMAKKRRWRLPKRWPQKQLLSQLQLRMGPRSTVRAMWQLGPKAALLVRTLSPRHHRPSLVL